MNFYIAKNETNKLIIIVDDYLSTNSKVFILKNGTYLFLVGDQYIVYNQEEKRFYNLTIQSSALVKRIGEDLRVTGFQIKKCIYL